MDRSTAVAAEFGWAGGGVVSVAGVGGGNRHIPEVEGAQRGAASQAVGDASPGDGVELVPAAWKQAPGQFTHQSEKGSG